jgi:hypothetical protein
VSVSQDEINTYIEQVMQAIYGEDNGSWEYSYTVDGRTYTYTYYGSGIRDYDDYDDYDYDIDSYD